MFSKEFAEAASKLRSQLPNHVYVILEYVAGDTLPNKKLLVAHMTEVGEAFTCVRFIEILKAQTNGARQFFGFIHAVIEQNTPDNFRLDHLMHKLNELQTYRLRSPAEPEVETIARGIRR